MTKDDKLKELTERYNSLQSQLDIIRASIAVVNDIETGIIPPTPAVAPKKRSGRPKGSKNVAKAAPVAEETPA